MSDSRVPPPWGAVAAVGIVIALTLAGRVLRDRLGLELSVESVRDWVHAFGWKAPVTFVGLVTFRQVLFLPAFLLLTAGGVAFGTGLGTALGTTGIVLSGSLAFGIARAAGHAWMPHRLRVPLLWIEARGVRAGTWLVGLATAYPIGPMLAAHWVAGFSRIPARAFLPMLVVAGVLRAAALSAFGATLVAWGPLRSTIALAVGLAILLLPVAHPRVRRGLAFP